MRRECSRLVLARRRTLANVVTLAFFDCAQSEKCIGTFGARHMIATWFCLVGVKTCQRQKRHHAEKLNE